jgi:transmembrane sensor
MIEDTENTPWEALARYLGNDPAPDDRRVVENWLAQSEANRQTLERLEQLWTTPLPNTPETDPAAVWERRIAPHLTNDEDSTPVRPLHRAWWQPVARSWRVAASIAGIALIGLATYRSVWREAPPAQVAQNPVGKRSLITLSDGSRVWLNADSRLEFPRKFAGSLREVRLVGEAFFDVKHNPAQPFVIRLETASIRVLGTSFNVRAYPGDATVKTTVLTGRVAFVPNKAATQNTARSSADTLFVTPDHRVVQQVQTLAVAEEPVMARKETAWKDNRLVFDQTPMSEVARTLERWYGLPVRLERTELANCPLTATFEGQSVREVMDLIGQTGRFRYSLSDTELIIKGSGCQ